MTRYHDNSVLRMKYAMGGGGGAEPEFVIPQGVYETI